MSLEKAESFMHGYPGMVAVVTSRSRGKDNVMAAGWHSPLSVDPPMYGVAVGRTRLTYQLIKDSGCFAVHFLPGEFAQAIQASGVWSGTEQDKIKRLNLTVTEAGSIEAPIIKEAYAAYECQLEESRSYGDHDWMAGRITGFWKNKGLFTEDGLPDWDHVAIPLYLGRSQYYFAEESGKRETFRIKPE